MIIARAHEELEKAFHAINMAERGEGGYIEKAIRHSLSAVALTLGAEKSDEILLSLPVLPPNLWGEVLRLIEINRLASIGVAGLDEAREAVEIAVAMYDFIVIGKGLE